MKNGSVRYLLAAVFLAPTAVQAQQVSSRVVRPLSVVEQGPHHRTWLYVTETELDGERIRAEHRYVELKSGMNVWSPAEDKWADASDEIEVVQNGAAGRKANHQVIFSANANDPTGTIDLLRPGNLRLRSRVLGIAIRRRAQARPC